MKFFFFTLFFFFCVSVRAQDLPVEAPAQADSTKLKIPSDTSSFYVIEMNDGTVLKGKIMEYKNGLISFRDNNLGVVCIKASKISSFEKLSVDSYFIFYMKDGSFLHGRIKGQNENEVEIETKNISRQNDSAGKKVIIPIERVKEMRQIEEKDIRKKGKYWYPNMNASRYFFGPSAIPVKQEEGYYQNADLLVNCANYGITKNISIQGGAIVPFAVFLMPKFGYKVKENLHVGAGMMYAQTLLKFRKSNYKAGAFYGLATYGSSNTNLTFGLGSGFINVNNETSFLPKPIIAVNGMARISRRIALVTENIIVPVKFSYYTAEGKITEFNYKTSFSFGGRFMKEKITVDFGILSIPNEAFSGFVFVGFAIKF